METQAQWGVQVQNFKDSEKYFDIQPYQSELLARDLLNFMRYHYFVKFILFRQRRGQEYELMLQQLTVKYGEAPVLRAITNDDLWEATIRLSGR
jgi:hypothetical protein